MNRFLSLIDRTSELTFNAVAWLVAIMTAVLGYEVLMRYFFNAPTVWVFDISYMLGGSFFLLGASYTLHLKGHVRIDIFYNRFSPRTQALIEIIFGLVLFFPLWIGLFIHLIPYVYKSWVFQERTYLSYWRPIIYPFKTVLPIGVGLLVLQAFAEFARSVCVLFQKEAA